MPMPNMRSKRLKKPGLDADRLMGSSGHRGLVERCALASLQRLLDLSIEAWVVAAPPGWQAGVLAGPTCRSDQQPTTPSHRSSSTDFGPDRRTTQSPWRAKSLPTERTPLRYARSPREAGGGHGDLRHNNDRANLVNRRSGIVDNFAHFAPYHRCGFAESHQFLGCRLASWDEENSADSQEREAQFGDDGERSQRPSGCHVESFPTRVTTEVLQPGVDDADILDVQPGRDRSHPVEPAPMRIDEGEGSFPERRRQREPRQARA